MSDKIFVPLTDDDDDPMILLGMQLEKLMEGIAVREGVVFEVESSDVADALKRILSAAGRDYQVLGQARGGYVHPSRLFIIGHQPDVVAGNGSDPHKPPAFMREAAEAIADDVRAKFRGVLARAADGQPTEAVVEIGMEPDKIGRPVEEMLKEEFQQVINIGEGEIETLHLSADGQMTVYMVGKLEDAADTGEPVAAVEETIAEVEPEFHQSEQVDGQGLEPVVANEPKQCEACGHWFTPTGTKGQAAKQKYCKEQECVKARNRQYVKNHYKSKKDGLSDIGPSSGPTDADLREAEAFEQELQAEMVQEQDPASPAEEIVELSEPSNEVEAQSDFRDRVWHVEDGYLAGQDLTAVQLRRHLKDGRLHSGQHVSHAQSGRHVVVKIPGKPGQSLRRAEATA